MKRWMYAAGAVLGLLGGLAALVWYSLSDIGGTVMETDIRSGSFGNYVIGQTKEEVLSFLPQSFTPYPKPAECPANWIDAAQMTETQKGCLLKTDHWDAGQITANRYLACPHGTDEHSTLRFKDGKLEQIYIRCTRAI